MSGQNDVQDILGDTRPEQSAASIPSKDAILSASKKKTKKQPEAPFKRPEGMSREVYALLCSDNTIPPQVVSSDTTHGYKAAKAKLGRASVRKWTWMPFKNPARSDGLVLNHWRRAEDEGKEYAFSRFDKPLEIIKYSDVEYEQHLEKDQQSEPSWNREETDHLFDLCRRFDLRFFVVHDRFDHDKYTQRSVEDIKERYYDVCNKIEAARSSTSATGAPLVCAYDAQHETLRKQQLEKLYSRTKEQVQEELSLLAELRKIDARRKERERKQMDLHKLMAAAEVSERKSEKKKSKKKGSHVPAPGAGKQKGSAADASNSAVGVFKPFDKAAGVSLRSSKIKLYPTSFPQRRSKVIDQVLEDLGVGVNPIATEKVCVAFNELRNRIVLLLELKNAADGLDYEIQSFKHEYEILVQSGTKTPTDATLMQELAKTPMKSATLQIIDQANSKEAGTTMRKRRATSSIDAAAMLKRKKT
ncbi:DNA methyltransferase 1-associated protein 1-like [Sycon ciliatum]|uniref:DNA methyltransferase 1-associated protein 1-like n=1 Tax=Sycon ciliatum TaxID=27933 RepID=UPI0020AE72D8|eukprot:scpid40128/ scgid24032/ DNA methyltransferase 1-associated protein 1